jgi:hypothetical protein
LVRKKEKSSNRARTAPIDASQVKQMLGSRLRRARKKMSETKEYNDSLPLLQNVNKLHTTLLGLGRIRKNLNLVDDDIIGWCKKLITEKNSIITRKGKNWYITNKNMTITVNAHSFTIITAHRLSKKTNHE